MKNAHSINILTNTDMKENSNYCMHVGVRKDGGLILLCLLERSCSNVPQTNPTQTIPCSLARHL